MFFDRKVGFETFRDEIVRLVLGNRDFFNESFPEVNFDDRENLTIYSWVKTRVEYAKSVIDKIENNKKIKQKGKKK